MSVYDTTIYEYHESLTPVIASCTEVTIDRLMMLTKQRKLTTADQAILFALFHCRYASRNRLEEYIQLQTRFPVVREKKDYREHFAKLCDFGFIARCYYSSSSTGEQKLPSFYCLTPMAEEYLPKLFGSFSYHAPSFPLPSCEEVFACIVSFQAFVSMIRDYGYCSEGVYFQHEVTHGGRMIISNLTVECENRITHVLPVRRDPAADRLTDLKCAICYLSACDRKIGCTILLLCEDLQHMESVAMGLAEEGYRDNLVFSFDRAILEQGYKDCAYRVSFTDDKITLTHATLTPPFLNAQNSI